jgi:hypothetical protein
MLCVLCGEGKDFGDGLQYEKEPGNVYLLL